MYRVQWQFTIVFHIIDGFIEHYRATGGGGG